MTMDRLGELIAPASSLTADAAWGMAAPSVLFLLLAVPLILALASRTRKIPTVDYGAYDIAEQSLPAPKTTTPRPALIMLCLALVAMVVSAAQPWIRVSLGSSLSTVMLVVDVSGSMEADDISPDRISVAAQAASRFVSSVPADMRVGLVTYSNEPLVAVPPTLDRKPVLDALELMEPGGATATGDALEVALSVGLAATGEVPGSVSLVLLSDGAEQKSTLPALVWADEARTWDVPVHTIAFGTDQGEVTMLDPQTQELVTYPVPPDLNLMEALADATGGTMSTAAGLAELSGVYAQVRSIVVPKDVQRSLAPVCALLALGLLAASTAFAAGSTRRTRM